MSLETKNSANRNILSVGHDANFIDLAKPSKELSQHAGMNWFIKSIMNKGPNLLDLGFSDV